jgi:hypothetical protein
MRWSGRRPAARLAVIAGVTAAVCAGVGVATGAIPGGDGKISACYGKVGGVMRVIDVEKGEKCSTLLEKPLSWNIAGRQGPPGESGPQGDPGAPGADAGPPAAFRSSFGTLASSLPASADDVNVQRLMLPAGDYLIWGRAVLGIGQVDAAVDCRLTPFNLPGLRSDEDFTRVRADPEWRTDRALSVTGSATLSEPTEIFLTCFASPLSSSQFPFDVGVELARMHALEVDLSP